MGINEEVAKAFGAHTLWTARIHRALERGKSEFRPEDVARDDLCTFGKWLRDPALGGAIRDSADYATTVRLHAEFHRLAAGTLAKAVAGNTAAVQQELGGGGFAKAAHNLYEAMFGWQRSAAAGCASQSPGWRGLCMLLRGRLSLRMWATVVMPSLAAWASLIFADLQQLHGIEAMRQTDPGAAALAWNDFLMFNGFFAVATLIGGLVVFQLARGITGPVRQLAEATRLMAKGDLTAALPAMDRADEIGELARALLVFQQQGVAAERLRAESEQQTEKNETERRAAILVMAESIKSQTGSVVDRIVGESAQVLDTAKRMAAGVLSVDEHSQRVATAAEQSLATADSVAATTAELSTSIREIAAQVDRSRVAVGDAVKAADNASTTVASLTDAMTAIDQVVQLIADIASQTNLLALNATIEAARAGEAGKGFAVVAHEVKLLATQTARQTDEITQRIASLKAMAGRVRDAIQGTATSVQGVEAIANSVAAAVERQDSAAKEISRDVHRSADAARQVTERILAVAKEALATGKEAGQVETMLDAMATHMRDLAEVLTSVVRSATADFDREAKSGRD